MRFRLPLKMGPIGCSEMSVGISAVLRGGLGCSNPPTITKALENRAKLNPIVKTVKNC